MTAIAGYEALADHALAQALAAVIAFYNGALADKDAEIARWRTKCEQAMSQYAELMNAPPNDGSRT